MVVQHNLTAMNSNRMLGVTTSSQAKTTEKLSSGYKINRAADDAAGLAISEKMRKQIRGLTQASANAQDGISAVQTAEGALTEVHDMLQRMNELAVKAANGTESESDRDAIQAEINQLTTEIDRVAETTKFNETYLLKGDTSTSAVKGYRYSYGAYETAVEGKVTMTNGGEDEATGISVTFSLAKAGQNNVGSAEDLNTLAKSIRDQGLTVTAISEALPTGANTTGTTTYTVKTAYSIALNGDAATNYKVVATDEDSKEFEIQDIKGNKLATVSLDDYSRVASAKAGSYNTDTITMTASYVKESAEAGERVQYYDADGNVISANNLSNYFARTSAGDIYQLAGTKIYDAVGNLITDFNTTRTGKDELTAIQDVTAALNLDLHVGADATKNNQISMNIDAMTAKGLGIVGLRVDGKNDTNALAAIETIKAAISKVSAQRSDLGAIQNRLEHTIKNLDNVVENTTSAESAIRDTDMATTMVQYSNNNILAQAGTSMLAQANQSNQSVLSLLQ